MKTPEEIKDSLKVCMAKLLIPKHEDCKRCPFINTEQCDGKRHAQALAYIERLEAEQVRKGKWLAVDVNWQRGYEIAECSECGKNVKVYEGIEMLKYCPRCGAKMDSGKGS